MKKLLLLSIMVFAVLFASMCYADSSVFSDVSENHWAYKSIARWSNENVIKGYSDGTFKPEQYITRAEYSALIVRLFEFSKGMDLSKYGDVNINDWFYDTLSKALAYKVIEEDTPTSIRPDGLVTRQEAVVTLNSVIKIVAKDGNNSIQKFPDFDEIGDYAEADIEAFVETVRLIGYTDGTLKPVKPVTRAEAAQILDRIFRHIAVKAGSYDMGNSDDVILVKSKDVKIENANNAIVIFLNDEVKESTQGISDVKKQVSVVINPETPSTPTPEAVTPTDKPATSSGDVAPEIGRTTKDTSGGSSTVNKTAVISIITVTDNDGNEYYKAVRNGVKLRKDSKFTIKIDNKTVNGVDKLVIKDDQTFVDALIAVANEMDITKIINTLDTDTYVQDSNVLNWGASTIADLVTDVTEYARVSLVARNNPDHRVKSVYLALSDNDKAQVKSVALNILNKAYNNEYSPKANDIVTFDYLLGVLNSFPNK